MIFSREDREICEALLGAAWESGDYVESVPELIVEAGRRFLGTTYEPDTLEREGEEVLVVNLRAFDCVTLVETAVAFALTIRAQETAFAAFAAALEWIRYRRGKCNGYASRLHYFTDWLFDNGRKGIVRDITQEIGGIPLRKELHALTDRRGDHPPLQDPAEFRRMRVIEGICSRRPLFYIPKADLGGIEKRIAAGAIIAITTDENGLDVSHAGIAARAGGQLRLLHASSTEGRVVLSEVPLDRYLEARPSRTGIIVGRAIAPEA